MLPLHLKVLVNLLLLPVRILVLLGAAEKYIKHAFGIILNMEIHSLCGINNHHDWYMMMRYDNHLIHPELYGLDNSCMVLYNCHGRLPSFGNALCYFSGGYGSVENMEITIVNKETDEYFSLDLYTSPCGTVYDPPIDTETY